MSNTQSHELGPEQPTTTTVAGDTDFRNVKADDVVVHHGPRTGRSILVDAGAALTADHQPVDTAPDGGVERLDGLYTTKLGGVVLDISVPSEHLRK